MKKEFAVTAHRTSLSVVCCYLLIAGSLSACCSFKLMFTLDRLFSERGMS